MHLLLPQRLVRAGLGWLLELGLVIEQWRCIANPEGLDAQWVGCEYA
jgi:hypothetical protein